MIKNKLCLGFVLIIYNSIYSIYGINIFNHFKGSNAGRDKGGDGDSAWCPKMRVRNLAVNQRVEPRPSRDNAKKVAAVEMGLKMAAEKRRKSSALAVSPNSLILHSSSPVTTKTGLKNKGSQIKKRKTQSLHPVTQTSSDLIETPTSFSEVGKQMLNPEYIDTPGNSEGIITGASSALSASSNLTKSSSGLMKPKKGSLTAKQRLGKILKLKF